MGRTVSERIVDMIIRKASICDTERIAETHKASIKVLCSVCYNDQDISGWTDILSPHIYEKAINENVMIVAEEGEEILGLGILDLVNKEIGAIYIHPKVKGMGVGKRLLLELESRASGNSIDRLTLCSTMNAIGFYKHHGYTDEDRSFHELPNGIKLKCIRMHKSLYPLRLEV